MKLQYFKNSTGYKFKGFLTFEQLILTLKNPKNKDIHIAIQKSAQTNNKNTKTELKRKLYSVIPTVNVAKYRRYSNITAFTGLTVLDFDNIDNAPELKEYLFETYKFIVAAWLSPSHKGVKALIKIPVIETTNPNKEFKFEPDGKHDIRAITEFQAYVRAQKQHFELFDGYDSTVNNAVLLMFLGYDPDILVRKNPDTWIDKLYKPKPVYKKQTDIDIKTNNGIKAWIFKDFARQINEIINSNGHPRLRNSCKILGGYVGSGYITHDEARNLAEQCININSYLTRGHGTARGYLKTAMTSISNGTKEPIYWNNKN